MESTMKSSSGTRLWSSVDPFNSLVCDERWSCLVVLLLEDPTLPPAGSGSPGEALEAAAGELKHPVIRVLTPRDLAPPTASAAKAKKQRHMTSRAPPLESRGTILRRLVQKDRDHDLSAFTNRLRSTASLSSKTTVAAETSPLEPDVPRTGPSRYYVLVRFQEPLIAEEIIGAGVPLSALFYLAQASSLPSFQSFRAPSQYMPRASALFKPNIPSFFEQIMNLYTDKNNSKIFADTAFFPIALSQNMKGNDLFNIIKSKLYFLTSCLRQYLHYVQCIRVVDMPEYNRIDLESKLAYNDFLKDIPLEYQTVEMVLQAILQQVDDDLNMSMTELDSCMGAMGPSPADDPQKNPAQKVKFIRSSNKLLKKLCGKSNQSRIVEKHCDLYMSMRYAKLWDKYPKKSSFERALGESQLRKLSKCIDAPVDRECLIQCINLMFLDSMTTLLNGGDMSIVNCSTNQPAFTFLKPNEYIALEESSDIENSLSSYHYYERMDPCEMLQSLNKAYYKFSETIFEYVPITDCLLMWFRNNIDYKGLANEKKSGYLPTVTNFRDFFGVVRLKERQWLKDIEGLISLIDEENKRSWIKRLFPDAVYELDEEEFNMIFPFPGEEIYQGKVDDTPQIWVYPNLCQDYILLNERTSSYTSVDGPSLTVQITEMRPYGKTVLLTCLTNGNSITTHRNLEGEDNSPTKSEDEDQDETRFLVETKQGIMISIVKTTRTVQSKKYRYEDDDSDKVVFDFEITLPNGLHIEIHRGNETYVKQKYLSKSTDRGQVNEEDSRIFLGDGTVLVFMSNGSVIILYPNSTETRMKSFRVIRPYYSSSEEERDAEEVRIARRWARVRPYIHQTIRPNGNLIEYVEGEETCGEELYVLRAGLEADRGLSMQRSDGTSSLITSSGLLSVRFPDGTAITSRPFSNIDWRQKEEGGGLGLKVTVPVFPIPSASVNESPEEELDDSFQVYGLHLVHRHPKYMTVESQGDTWIVHLPHGVELVSNTLSTFEIRCDEHTRIRSNELELVVYSTNPWKRHAETRTHFFLNDADNIDNLISSIIDSDFNGWYITKHGHIDMYNSSAYEVPLEQSYSDLLPAASGISMVPKYSVLPEENAGWVITGLRPKHQGRYFVVNRDLSGVEFIHDVDNEFALMQASGDQVVNGSYSGYSIRKERGFIFSQKPLLQTWSDSWFLKESHHVEDNYKTMKMSGALPHHKTWLFDLDPGDCKLTGFDMYPFPCEQQWKYPAILIRTVHSLSSSNQPVREIVLKAIKCFDKLNKEVYDKFDVDKYEKHRFEENQEREDMFKKGFQYWSPVEVPTFSSRDPRRYI